MRKIFCMAMMALAALEARAAKSPAEHYRGRPGYFNYHEIEALKKDIPMAKRILAECITSEQYIDRYYCANMGGDVGSKELIEELRPYLKDAHADVRGAAMLSLVNIAREGALPWIEPLLDDPDSHVNAAY